MSAANARDTRLDIENEELFRRLVASVHDYAIFVLDTTGHVATWNQGAQRIKGYLAGEIVGQHFSRFYLDEEVRSGKCDEELRVAAEVGRFEDEGWRVRKDGTRFWANVIISAMRDDGGKLIGFSKVTRDLTERRRAEDERAARLAAEQANRAKDEFLAVLGHELRNPLAPIVTALQLMKLRGDQRTSKEQQVIERQVKHMMRLVDDLLDVARITRGKLELERVPVDIRVPLSKAIEIVSPLLEQRSHVFEIDVPDREITVDADDARLTQVFANLLNNAAKYTEPNGHIHISVTVSGSSVAIEIKDDGIGISPELLPKLFELFTQGPQTVERPIGGLGIGLTVVRSLVELHGGSIDVETGGSGKGASFTVRLPISEASRRMPLMTTHIAPRLAARSRRILIVDDNTDALAMLAEVLSSVGHDVITARDAAEALSYAAERRPEVAILDIGLPVVDGYELADRLREQLSGAVPRLIALTGYGQPHDQVRSARAGFYAHLVKPVDAQRLLDCIGS